MTDSFTNNTLVELNLNGESIDMLKKVNGGSNDIVVILKSWRNTNIYSSPI